MARRGETSRSNPCAAALCHLDPGIRRDERGKFLSYDTSSLIAQLRAAHGLDRLMALTGDESLADTAEAVLEEASRFAAEVLAPLNPLMDREGCRLEDGRVKTAPGHKAVWDAFCEAGWQTLDKPADWGGQGLPLVVWAAAQELFDRASVAFGMLPSSQGAASRLLEAHASDAIKAEWLPKLASGEWASTIVISEAEAGSDVGRIRTRAEPAGDGEWLITGEKIWITFADHDLAPRIGHCVLARAPGGRPGGAGLSLFLVPSVLEDGSRNPIVVRRIEEKMGLHGSPTCAVGFEGARGRLIGQEGRGLAQLFAMITQMRLSVGVQGLGLASLAAETALAYAAERRQGGPPDQPPVTLDSHPDVQRMLLQGQARLQTLRGLVYATAVQADLAALETDPEARVRASDLAAWLLPLVKTLGGEVAFDTASEAIQVLGGAGYVNDWPVEQALRDSRVFTIYEGASGMQALDLLHRRLWRDEGRGLKAFLGLARADLDDTPEAAAVAFVLDCLEDAGEILAGYQGAPREGEAGSYAFLQLAGLAATGWIALRLSGLGDARLAAAGRFWLSDIEPRASLEHARIAQGAGRLEGFEPFRAR
jgi:alkylation response protein AidB-like acyl-CoA dehydrogenase